MKAVKLGEKKPQKKNLSEMFDFKEKLPEKVKEPEETHQT